MRVNNCSNADSSAKANSFLKQILNFQFIVTLVITRIVLDYTLDVTRLLQGRANDLAEWIRLVESMKDQICSIRENVDDNHKKWYGEAVKFATKMDIEEREQIFRANPSNNRDPSDYKRVLTIPLLGHLVSEFHTRFQKDSLNAYLDYIQFLRNYYLRLINLPNNGIKTLQHFSFEGFSNIKVLFRILATLPVTVSVSVRDLFRPYED